MAGITLAALGTPEVMGYTVITGTPVITGLYTLFLPVLIYALFGSSRHLVVSADSATAAMVAAGLTSLSFTANTPKYVALTSLTDSRRPAYFSWPESFAWVFSPISFLVPSL
jgi:sulfate permease, SulP family